MFVEASTRLFCTDDVVVVVVTVVEMRWSRVGTSCPQLRLDIVWALWTLAFSSKSVSKDSVAVTEVGISHMSSLGEEEIGCHDI